jgi:hypothetical protein
MLGVIKKEQRAGIRGRNFWTSRRQTSGHVWRVYFLPLEVNLELKSHLMVVWVPDTNISNIEYSGIEQPDLIIKSLEGFVPEEWGLKPYAGTTSGS